MTERFEDDGDVDELSRHARRDYFLELLREALGNQADQIKALSTLAVKTRAVA